MVHNGIEYAMMQAYAEGYELLEKVDIVDNVTEVFDSWREGTVVRSWLLDLLVKALEEDPGLAKIRGYAEDSGEGRWTVEAAIDNAVPMHAIAASLFARFASRQDESPAMQAVAAMRNQFGGHAVQAAEEKGNAAAPTADRLCRARHPPDPARLPVVRRGRGRPRAGRRPRSSGPTGRARRTWSRRSTTSSRLDSHRVAARAPLVRAGAERAVVRADVVRGEPHGAARGRDHAGQVQPGPHQPRRRCPGRGT